MFGSKKESEPLQPFNLKVLSALHVVEGTAAGDARLMFGDSDILDRLELSSATITCIDLRQPVVEDVRPVRGQYQARGSPRS